MVESKFAILDITSKLLNWLNESRLSYNYSQSQKESNSKDANQKVKTQYFNDIEIDNGLIKIRITNHHPNYQNYYNRYKNGEIMPLSDSNNISIEFYEKSVKRNRIYNKVKPSEDDDNPQEFTINIFNYMPSKLDKGDLDTIFKSITSFIQSGDKYVDPFAGTPKEAISSAKLSKFEHTQIDKYSNKLLNKMRYNEKRSLYESIMKDVAKIIKTNLNESYQSTKIKRFLQLSNEYYQELLKDPDHNYQILGKKGFFQLTKIIQIKAYDDITTDGVVHELINGNIWGNTKFASTITDEQCISNIMTNEQIIKNNIFKPQNRDRYFIICYSFGVRKGNTNRLEYGVNIDHIKYAMELNADAIKELTNEYNKHKQREQVKKQREQDKEDEYDKLRKDKMFDKSVDELGKKLYRKAVTAFDNDQINEVVSILNSLYHNGGDEDIIYQLVYLLNELI